MNEFFGKKVFVLGDGVSGSGARNALKKCGSAICSKLAENLDYIIVSPGISTDNEIFSFAIANKIKIIGELELGYRLCNAPIIAVTGTNGKTTVTALIGEILRQGGYNPIVCGNIGVSFAQSAVYEEYDVAVVETSSFQLETIKKFHPYIAVITNLTPDHLDRHKTLVEYFKQKRKIARNQTAQDFLVVPDSMKISARSRVITFDGGDCCIEQEKIVLFDKELLALSDVTILGHHNVLNVMAAATACSLFGVQAHAIRKAVSNFRTARHRIEFVAQKNGISYFDDSKGTNIASVLCAVQSMQGDTCLIVCGNDKGYEYDELFLALDEKVKSVVAFGEIKNKVVSATKRCGYENLMLALDMADAVKKATASGCENVLLSPGTSSFDMYSGYDERGDAFALEVKKLC